MPYLHAERLTLHPLQDSDAAFILELVNTEGWKRFIGERNVHTEEDACAYIQRLMLIPFMPARVVRLIESQKPIGIITWVQRPYLTGPDLGFAFLPEYQGKGFAEEACKQVIQSDSVFQQGKPIYAICSVDNEASIRLLKKLHFVLKRILQLDNENLLLFELRTAKIRIVRHAESKKHSLINGLEA